MMTPLRVLRNFLSRFSRQSFARRQLSHKRPPLSAEILEDRCLLSVGLPVDSQFEVNETEEGLSSQPAVARGANGDYLTAWVQKDQGLNVLVRRFDSLGAPMGQEVQVNETEADVRGQVSVSALAGGGYVVLWSGTGSGDSRGVFGRVLGAEGAPIGSEFRVNSTTGGQQRTPDVVGQPDGGFVAVWFGRGRRDSEGLFGRRFDTNGNPVGGEFLVNETTAGMQTNPSLAKLANGRFIITWQGRGEGDREGVFFRMFDENGQAIGSETLANESMAGIQANASVTDLIDSTFAIAWDGQGAGDAKGIYARIFSSDGSPIGGEFLINQSTAGLQQHPTIIHRGPDGFIVAWEGRGLDDAYGIYERQFSPLGAAITDEERVNSMPGGAQRSVALTGGDQGFFAVFEDSGSVGGLVYATNRALTTDPDVQQMPSVAVNPLDSQHVVVAYMDYSLVETGYAGIGVKVSHDGGVTWETSQIPVLENFNEGAANPIAKFDDQGHLYVVYQAATFLGPNKPELTNPGFGIPRTYGFQSNNGIFIVRSDDGGLTWNTPVGIEEKLYDGINKVNFDFIPDLAIDLFPMLPNDDPNPYHGNLYVTFSRAYVPGTYPGVPTATGGIEIMFAVSDDEGETWEIKREFIPSLSAFTSVISVDTSLDDEGTGTNPGEGYIDQAHLAIGVEGEIYVSHFGAGNFAVAVSRNGGTSFQTSDIEMNKQIVFGTAFTTAVNGTLPNNEFRTHAKRAIAADPTRPGHIYAVEPILNTDEFGNPIDAADIFFGRSSDFAESWQTTFMVGSIPDLSSLPVGAKVPLNDDNDAQIAASTAEVTSSQAFSTIVTDAQGNIAVIWYDTRRDPDDTRLDVFGAISTDGGMTFTPNFRITNQSFDANDGSFINAVGQEEFYIGDFIGLAMAEGMGYAVWVDTRNGNQDLFFARFPTSPAPGPLNDRFEPNDSPRPDTTTDIGAVIQETIPQLTATPGDEDWFLVEASAQGNLIVDVLFSDADLLQDDVLVELWNETGMSLLGTSGELRDSGGNLIGERVTTAATAGDKFQIRITGVGEDEVDYSLLLESLTANLGPRVHTTVSGQIASGDRTLYLFEPPANGAVEIVWTPDSNVQGNLQLRILDANTLDVLATGIASAGIPGELSLPVRGDEKLLIEVTSLEGASGEFEIELTNFDRFSITGSNTLFAPVPSGPSQSTVADLNDDGHLDVIVVSGVSDTVSVFLGNGDGTLQTARQFAIGAYVTPASDITTRIPTFGRDVAVVDFNEDDIPDIVATNFASADVSVLIGNGDGTFQPQRRFDLTPGPYDLDVGDINGDGFMDIVAIESGLGSRNYAIGVLLGKGDGTFERQLKTFISLNGNNNGAVRIVDIDEDGMADIIHSGGGAEPDVAIFLGNGDGTFNFAGNFLSGRIGVALAVGDINDDDNLDIATVGFEAGRVVLLLGNGDATFDTPIEFFGGSSPTAAQIVDVGSEVTLGDGTKVLGPPDGRPDLVVAYSGVQTFVTLPNIPEVVVYPAVFNDQNEFVGLGQRQVLTGDVEAPIDVDVADLDGDMKNDAVVLDRDGVLIVFNDPPTVDPNDTLTNAQDLGVVVHLVQPTLSLVPGHVTDFFKFIVPEEAIGGGDQVIDFSALFEAEEGAGLQMEVLDSVGNVLGSGSRFRIQAAQGAELTVHVFGLDAESFGAYTLVINVLPQVVSVESQALLPGVGGQPGGPTGNIVITLQGDRLDRATAETPASYIVTYLGADGMFGTLDDVVRSVDRIVYSSATNVEPSSGRTFPTTVRQTINLEFDEPLEAGSYRIEILPQVQTQSFTDREAGLLAEPDQFSGHSVVSVNGQIQEGAVILADDLVQPAGALGDFSAFFDGTPFLTQLHDDLQAILDASLSSQQDDPNVTMMILTAISNRIAVGLGEPGFRPTRILVIFLDPVPFDFDGSMDGLMEDIASYDEESEPVVDDMSTYVEVGSSVELIIIAEPDADDFLLTISEADDTSRAGYVLFDDFSMDMVDLTEEIRSGEESFDISFE